MHISLAVDHYNNLLLEQDRNILLEQDPGIPGTASPAKEMIISLDWQTTLLPVQLVCGLLCL